MKFAIHHSQYSFSKRWIEYCIENNITYKVVNCYDSDIIKQLKGFDVLMWHHHHTNYRDVLFAKSLLFSLEQAGIKVFPNFNTSWHFDDKIGQKYLLEAINAPLVPSFVFYSKKDALDWVNSTTFPKVFKLRGGAGSQNVSLVHNQKEAVKKINRAFGKGFPLVDNWYAFKEMYHKKQPILTKVMNYTRTILTGFRNSIRKNLLSREKGYVYFQEFIPNNKFDIRVIIVGNKAFALKRMTRENDFRASGSGNIIYEKKHIDIRCVEISFEVNEKIEAQSIAFDFVFDSNNTPLVVEISYGYAVEAYDPCPGYWDRNLIWHKGKFNPQRWMIEMIIK